MKKLTIFILVFLSHSSVAWPLSLEQLNEDLDNHKPSRSLMRYRNGLVSTFVMGSSKENIDLP